MNQNIKKFDWVDALRGYAILMVIMIHCSHFFLDGPLYLKSITKLGDLGVMLFFIASSFTLFNSYQIRSATEGKFVTLFFLIRRFFRIAPLYYLCGVFYMVVGLFFHSRWAQPPFDVIKLFANYLFLNGIYLPAINYIPPGGWSIGVEMLFYLSIPFLFRKIKNFNTALRFLLLSIFFSFLLQFILYFLIVNYTSYSWLELRGWQLYFWLPNQFPVFCFGILLFYTTKLKSKHSDYFICLSFILIAIFNTFNFKLDFPYFFLQREYFFSIAFFIFSYSISNTKYTFLIKPINKLGKLSFSAYLLHFFIIEVIYKIFKVFFKDGINNDINFLIVFISVVFTTYFVSKLTYNLELFGISIGELLINMIKQKSPVNALNFNIQKNQ